MREKHTVQRSIFEHYAEHEIGRELKAMSDWLDQHLDLLDRVAADIKPCNVEDTGRKGLSVESVLRCAILKQFRQLSYEELVFCLMDSASCQTFARLSLQWFPRKSVLQSCISAISAGTWIDEWQVLAACRKHDERQTQRATQQATQQATQRTTKQRHDVAIITTATVVPV